MVYCLWLECSYFVIIPGSKHKLRFLECSGSAALLLLLCLLLLSVVHEMNGEDGVQPLSSSEVEELIHKADEALMMSQPNAVVTSPQTVEVEEEAAPPVVPTVPGAASRLGASANLELSAAGASEQKPVTMVFMGYQSVEDEDQTKKVLGLQEMVKAELVLITDSTASPDEGKEETSPLPNPSQPSEALAQAELPRAGAAELRKEKQLCVCCSIM